MTGWIYTYTYIYIYISLSLSFFSTLLLSYSLTLSCSLLLSFTHTLSLSLSYSLTLSLFLSQLSDLSLSACIFRRICIYIYMYTHTPLCLSPSIFMCLFLHTSSMKEQKQIPPPQSDLAILRFILGIMIRDAINYLLLHRLTSECLRTQKLLGSHVWQHGEEPTRFPISESERWRSRGVDANSDKLQFLFACPSSRFGAKLTELLRKSLPTPPSENPNLCCGAHLYFDEHPDQIMHCTSIAKGMS